MSKDILTPVGRLVSGHPMEMFPVIDEKTKQQKTFKDGSPMFTQSVGIAFPKNGTTDWKQTDWGQQIYAAAVAAYPRGEHGMRTFSWKITDGDSTEPNKKMIAPCTREGYPGHWVLFASSCFPTPCYHVGKYQPHEVIQNKNEIKRGDYVRLSFSVAPNKSSDSPGMYINPSLLELSRAGQQIMSGNAPDAAGAFGSVAPVVPQDALIDTGVTQTTPVTPAHDLVQPQVATPPPPPPVAEQGYIVSGTSYTKAQLLAMPGWTEAHLANLPRG